jgi:hypothetical protein
MEFEKHHIMPTVKRVMEDPKLSEELLDKLEYAGKIIYGIDNLITMYAARVKKLSQDVDSDKGDMLKIFSEMAFIGYITTHIKRIDKLIEELGYVKMNMRSYECFQDYAKKEMSNIEKELGITPEMKAEIIKNRFN